MVADKRRPLAVKGRARLRRSTGGFRWLPCLAFVRRCLTYRSAHTGVSGQVTGPKDAVHREKDGLSLLRECDGIKRQPLPVIRVPGCRCQGGCQPCVVESRGADAFRGVYENELMPPLRRRVSIPEAGVVPEPVRLDPNLEHGLPRHFSIDRLPLECLGDLGPAGVVRARRFPPRRGGRVSPPSPRRPTRPRRLPVSPVSRTAVVRSLSA